MSYSGRGRIILHGKQRENEALRAAVGEMRSEGHDLDVRLTWEAGDSTRLAEEAVTLGFGTVIAAGGDGSVNEVVQGLVFHSERNDHEELPVVGVLPLGTANDFATSAGIPSDDLVASLRIALTAEPVRVDVAHHAARVFVNLATGGFGTEVTTETPETLKQVLGSVAYFVTGLTKLGALAGRPARVEVDDFKWEGEFLVMAVGNGRQAGGGRVLCPEARIDDGLLDVAILPGVGEDELPSVLEGIASLGFRSFEERLVRARGRQVLIEADEELTLNFDGEPVTERRFSITVDPGRLRLRLPPGSPLLSNTTDPTGAEVSRAQPG